MNRILACSQTHWHVSHVPVTLRGLNYRHVSFTAVAILCLLTRVLVSGFTGSLISLHTHDAIIPLYLLDADRSISWKDAPPPRTELDRNGSSTHGVQNWLCKSIRVRHEKMKREEEDVVFFPFLHFENVKEKIEVVEIEVVMMRIKSTCWENHLNFRENCRNAFTENVIVHIKNKVETLRIGGDIETSRLKSNF